MKRSLAILGLVACLTTAADAQTCANGVCTVPRRQPMRTVVHAATAPVRHVVRQRPVRRLLGRVFCCRCHR